MSVGSPSGVDCHPVSDLGIPAVRSAARGFGDGTALELFSDGNCATSAVVVFSDLPDTLAESYRLLPIPG